MFFRSLLNCVSSGNKHGKLLFHQSVGGACVHDSVTNLGLAFMYIESTMLTPSPPEVGLRLLGKYVTRRGVCIPFAKIIMHFRRYLIFF